MIVVENLTKRFGENKALADISLEVSQNEVLALVGPSGCGKSTLLRIIAGLEKPDTGNVYIDGNIASSSSNMIPPAKRRLAMIFQDLALWPHMTAEAHLRFVLKAQHRFKDSLNDNIQEIFTAVSLSEHAKHYPHQLSGGEQQRLAIGRALAQNPTYMLMDEPFSSLDPILKGEMELFISALKARLEMGIIYVTHNVEDLVRIADRIAVMDQGELKQIGEKKTILNQPKDDFVRKILKIGEHPNL
jgi:ABC-type sugar transport system ATPase subunit